MNTNPHNAKDKMRAVVRTEYGSPDMLHLAEIDKLVPVDDEFLVHLHIKSVNYGVQETS